MNAKRRIRLPRGRRW